MKVDVFIEGPSDPTPAGRARLAASIAREFGLDAETVHARLVTGRLRARSDIPLDEADRLVARLAALGAIAVVRPAASATSPPLRRHVGVARPTPPVLRTTTASRALASGGDVDPGLAPFDAVAAADRAPDGSLPPRGSRATVDGVVVAPEPASATGGLFPLVIEDDALELAETQVRDIAGRASERAPVTEPARAPAGSPAGDGRGALGDGAQDRKATIAPGGQRARSEPALELATDRAAAPRRGAAASFGRATTAPAPAPPPRGTLAPLPAEPEPGEAPTPPFALTPRRRRLLASVGLGLLLGFLPAHLYARHAERSYDRIRDEIAHAPPPTSVAAYDALVERHHDVSERLRARQRRIQVATGCLWALAAAAIARGARRVFDRAR